MGGVGVSVTIETQRAFGNELLEAVKAIPLNHAIEPTVMRLIDKHLGGRVMSAGLTEDISTLLGLAFDVASLRTREHTDAMDNRTQEWLAKLATRGETPKAAHLVLYFNEKLEVGPMRTWLEFVAKTVGGITLAIAETPNNEGQYTATFIGTLNVLDKLGEFLAKQAGLEAGA